MLITITLAVAFILLILFLVPVRRTDHGISARIDTDSVNEDGDRIVTWVLKYHRYVHADLMTHRVFSRNGASSRAIPISQMLRAVVRNPATPIIWGGNGKGMQAHGELGRVRRHLCAKLWRAARWPAVIAVWTLSRLGLHKQWSNRMLEPWLFMTVVMTTTEHENFLDLRDSEFAQPEIAELARQMRRELAGSRPKKLRAGEWHIPMLTSDEREYLFVAYTITRVEEAAMREMPSSSAAWRKLCRRSVVPALKEIIERFVKIATARCARISYIRHDMIKPFEEDAKMHDRLAASRHWSPFEHCAEAAPGRGWIGNFHGWAQYRKSFPNESGRKVVQ